MLTEDALRQTVLLGQCTSPDLQRVMQQSTEIALAPSEYLFSDDDQAEEVWVLLDGELIITKQVEGDAVIIDHLLPGAFLGEISLLTGTPAAHRARAKGAARLLRIPGDVFRSLLSSCATVTETVLRTMAERVRRIEHLLQQHERMAGLGTIAAGLAHELNNPASAANRAARSLADVVAALQPLARRLAERAWTPEELALLAKLQGETEEGTAASASIDALERSDREEALADWLTRHDVGAAAELATGLADAGLTPDKLDAMAAGNCPALADALAWTERTLTIGQLLGEIAQSTTRMSELVRAVKAYSHIDTVTLRQADVHEGLDNTLTILGHKLREAKVAVVREYDRSLPRVPAFGSELLQVWTNLIDNAVDALGGQRGTVRVRTSRVEDGVAVEIVDDGPGIPAAIQERIFDPFFTTKAVGKGTGLGLEIVKRIVSRHHGSVRVVSRAGETRFEVRLPLSVDAGPAGVVAVNQS